MAVNKTQANIDELEEFFTRQNERKNAPALRLEPGQMVKARLAGVMNMTSDWGSYPALSLEVVGDNNNVTLHTFHAFHQMAQERLRELKPKTGDLMFISYPGEMVKQKATEKEIAEGKGKYHLYNIDTAASLIEAQKTLDSGEYVW